MKNEEVDLRIDHQVAIGGRVRLASGSPAPSAIVELIGMPAEWQKRTAALGRAGSQGPDQTTTAANGSFYFLDLPDGQYTLNLPDQTGKNAIANVSRDAAGRIAMAWVELTWVPQPRPKTAPVS